MNSGSSMSFQIDGTERISLPPTLGFPVKLVGNVVLAGSALQFASSGNSQTFLNALTVSSTLSQLSLNPFCYLSLSLSVCMSTHVFVSTCNRTADFSSLNLGTRVKVYEAAGSSSTTLSVSGGVQALSGLTSGTLNAGYSFSGAPSTGIYSPSGLCVCVLL